MSNSDHHTDSDYASARFVFHGFLRSVLIYCSHRCYLEIAKLLASVMTHSTAPRVYSVLTGLPIVAGMSSFDYLAFHWMPIPMQLVNNGLSHRKGPKLPIQCVHSCSLR